MPPVSTSDFRNGITLDISEGLMQIIDFQHVKPGKGGAFVRTKLRNIRTGAVLERTYNAGEKMEQAIIDNREMQFLYKSGDDFVFMDTANYEQLDVAPTTLGESTDYQKTGNARNRQSHSSSAVR
jgi:elongation factor P